MIGFNTQPPEGGWKSKRPQQKNQAVSTHSRPKAAGFLRNWDLKSQGGFNTQPPEGGWFNRFARSCGNTCFNTQPPEGGWIERNQTVFAHKLFQHTAARRRLGINEKRGELLREFQHTAARRRLDTPHIFLRHTVWFQHTAARRRLDP